MHQINEKKHLFLVQCIGFRLIDCKAMDKPATTAYSRWRIADVLTKGLIRTRLCFCSTQTTVGGEKDRGVEKLSYFPPAREGEIPMWLNNNVALPHQREVQGSWVQSGRRGIGHRASVIEVQKCHWHHKKHSSVHKMWLCACMCVLVFDACIEVFLITVMAAKQWEASVEDVAVVR